MLARFGRAVVDVYGNGRRDSSTISPRWGPSPAAFAKFRAIVPGLGVRGLCGVSLCLGLPGPVLCVDGAGEGCLRAPLELDG